jgi:hypothetical protein
MPCSGRPGSPTRPWSAPSTPADLHPGFVALEVPRAGTDPQTSDEFVHRLHAFFAALPSGEFPHTVELGAQLARISTDDQFQFGIRTLLAGLVARRA